MAAGDQLKSELARVCVVPLDRDANRWLGWVNSVCALFLLIGIAGARSNFAMPRRPPAIEQPAAVITELVAPPPPSAEPKQIEPQNQEQNEAAPQVVAVTLNTPKIDFAVPTIGNLLAPMTAAPAPAPVELQPATPVNHDPVVSGTTGVAGDRPAPPYPDQALELGQQGAVQLTFTVDDLGAVQSVSVKETSGFPLLDRAAANCVKHHWIQPPVGGSHLFVTTIRFKIQ